MRKYSQNGEDGIISIIFHKIGTTNKFFVELGVEDGKECNTRNLLKQGWQGLQIDCIKSRNKFVKKEFITAENVNVLLKKYRVPKNFDLLSIDLDGNDYWIWKAIKNYEPRVVIVEYNGVIPVDEAISIPYDPSFVWDGTDFFGASLLALRNLAELKGYELLGCDSRGVNVFFCKKELVDGNFETRDIKKTYKPYKYRHKPGGKLDSMITV